MLRRLNGTRCVRSEQIRTVSHMAGSALPRLTLSQLAHSSPTLPNLSAAAPGQQPSNASYAGAGVQIQLPPLVNWEADLPDLLSTAEAYLSALRPDSTAATDGARDRRVSGPLFLALRLFPDAALAALANRARVDAEALGSQRSTTTATARRPEATAHAGAAPIHRVPLRAFLQSDQHPWGAGVDPERTFKSALRGLAYLSERLAGRVPIVLVVPTRLMVSQRFCEGLFAMAAASPGIATVAFELPSTATLLDKETQAEREAYGQLGAVTQRWHRLSPLCTPWADLTRLPTFRSLRDVSCHQVMPLHVLLPWLRAQGILDSSGPVELGVTVDTTPARTRYARRRAQLEGPNFLVDDNAQHALAFPTAAATGDADGGIGGDTQHHYMSSPLDKGLTRSWLSHRTDSAQDTDEETSGRREARSGAPSWTETARVVEEALATHKEKQQSSSSSPAPTALHTRHQDHHQNDMAGGLSLGPPPDDVKALILRSLQAASATGDTASEDQLKDEAARREREASQALFAMLSSASASASSSSSTMAVSLEDELAFVQRRSRLSDAHETNRNPIDALARSVQRASAGGDDADQAHGTASASRAPSRALSAGYWQCLACVSRHVLPAAFFMSMPTLNAAQVVAWQAQAEASRAAMLFPAKSLPFVPVLLPILSAPALEAQRILREGPQRRHRHHDHHSEEEKNGGVGSLLGTVDGPLQSLMETTAAVLKESASTMPLSVARALAMQRPTVGHGEDGDAASSSRDDGSHHGVTLTKSDGDFVVRRKVRRDGLALRPLEYAPPAFVGPFVPHLADADVAGPSARRSRDAVQQVRDLERAFEQETLESELHKAALTLRKTVTSPMTLPPQQQQQQQQQPRAPAVSSSPTCVLSLSVPAPGLDSTHLLASWGALFP